jgi:hypothetical protein
MSSSPDSVPRAASTAARAASSNSIGTTIPGSTIDSLKNNTGTDLTSAINPPKFSQIDSTLGETSLFPVPALFADRINSRKPAVRGLTAGSLFVGGRYAEA